MIGRIGKWLDAKETLYTFDPVLHDAHELGGQVVILISCLLCNQCDSSKVQILVFQLKIAGSWLEARAAVSSVARDVAFVGNRSTS